MTAALTIEGLHKSFGKLDVLLGIDLELAEHEVVCLIGASGSGKSTLLRCVNLLEPIDSGRMVLHGEEITDPRIDMNAVRRRIGIVFQAFNLFPHMSVLDNVTLGPQKALRISRADAAARATELLARFGLADKRDEFPDRLSGGQQQRAAIARAIVAKPKLILADEPTGNLDSANGEEVMRLLSQLNEEGTTVIMVTHSPHDANYAHRIINLFDGKVVTESIKERFHV